MCIRDRIPPDQYAVLVREFCEQQFVSKGMIVDFAKMCIRDRHQGGRLKGVAEGDVGKRSVEIVGEAHEMNYKRSCATCGSTPLCRSFWIR